MGTNDKNIRNEKNKTQQNKSIRIIFKAGRRTRVSDLYKKGNILAMEDICLHLLKISYRYVNNKLPIQIVNLF